MDGILRQITEREEPSARASYEAGINAVEIGKGVRSYLVSPSPDIREKVEPDGREFREALAACENLAETEEARDLGREFSALSRTTTHEDSVS